MMRSAGTLGAVGIEIFLAIAVGYFGGEYLDRRFGSTPWLKWIGFAAGVGAAIKALVRVVRIYNKTLKEEEAASPPVATPANEDAPQNDRNDRQP